MYQKIMVPLDGSGLAECVIPHLESLAKGCSPREIVLVTAVEPRELWPTPSEPDGTSAAQKVIEDQRREHEHDLEQARQYIDGVVVRISSWAKGVHGEVLSGRVGESLIGFAESHGLDLVIMATHGRSGPSRWIWGSVADRLLRGTCVPILMVRAPGCPIMEWGQSGLRPISRDL